VCVGQIKALLDLPAEFNTTYLLHWEQKVFVRERSAGPFFSETQSCTAKNLL
jgi:hypothetical protein